MRGTGTFRGLFGSRLPGYGGGYPIFNNISESLRHVTGPGITPPLGGPGTPAFPPAQWISPF